MESKYYTPDISEFHVGFEFESNYILFNNGKPGDEFVPAILTEDNISWMLQSYFEDATPTEFRVKYLDKQDIESLGFECIKDDDEYHYRFSKPWYNNSDLIMEYYIWYTGLIDSEEVTEHRKIHLYQINGTPVIYKHDGMEEKVAIDRNIFLGTIKNKSELKVLLKQLGINE